MNDLYITIGSQPIWIQVVIALVLFFVGMPLLMVLVLGLISAFVSVGMVVLFAAVIVGGLYFLWLASAELVVYPAFQIGSFFSLDYKNYETVLHIASILFFALEVFALVCVLLWHHQKAAKQLLNGDKKPIAYLFGRAFGKYSSKIRTWYSATNE